MIYYLLYFKGFLVSDFIFDYCFMVYYVFVGDVIKLLKWFGYGCFMVKMDVKLVFLFIVKSKDKCVGDL